TDPTASTRRSQLSCGAIVTSKESEPSSRSPYRHSTKPPYTERQADPEPCRVIRDKAGKSISISNASVAAPASAANPDADDAKPAAVGTAFSDWICANKFGLSP